MEYDRERIAWMHFRDGPQSWPSDRFTHYGMDARVTGRSLYKSGLQNAPHETRTARPRIVAVVFRHYPIERGHQLRCQEHHESARRIVR